VLQIQGAHLDDAIMICCWRPQKNRSKANILSKNVEGQNQTGEGIRRNNKDQIENVNIKADLVWNTSSEKGSLSTNPKMIRLISTYFLYFI
jgi:hypothetical protein